MLYLEKEKFYIDPDKKVVKASEYASYMEGMEIVELAKQKALQIEEEAREAFEAEKKRGFEEGMEEGNERISELMIDTIDRSVKNFEEFENDVIDVVMKALRKIIGESDKGDLTSRIVRNALETVRSQKRVTLFVAPAQVQHVNDQLSAILADFPSISYIDVTSDNRIDEGGCMLETEMGVVDATIEVQLKAIRNSLTKSIK